MERLISNEEHRDRITRLQGRLADRGFDGAIVWSRGGGTNDAYADVMYLTGFYTPIPRLDDQPPYWAGRSYTGLYVPADGEPTLIVDVPDWRPELIAVEDVRLGIDVPKAVADVVKEKGNDRGTIALVGSEVIVMAAHARLAESLPNARIEPADALVLELRIIKSEAEIAALRRAGEVGAEHVSEMMRVAQQPGRTEAEAVAASWKVAIEMGASPWDSAVGSGPYSHFYASQGLPEWSTRTLEAGDIFTVDTYGSVEGYLYDISRSCVCGEKATPDQLQVLEGGVNCVNAIIDVVKPGVRASKLFEAGMQSMIDQGFVSDGSSDGGDVGISYAELFPAFGHGYGLALEAPWLVVDEHSVLEENMALAIETLAGRPGIGGAKFEQNVIVRADGAELVSPAPTHWWTG